MKVNTLMKLLFPLAFGPRTIVRSLKSNIVFSKERTFCIIIESIFYFHMETVMKHIIKKNRIGLYLPREMPTITLPSDVPKNCHH